MLSSHYVLANVLLISGSSANIFFASYVYVAIIQQMKQMSYIHRYIGT